MAADAQAEEAGARREPVLAGRLGRLDRLVEEGLRPGELPDRHHRLRQVGQERQPVVALGRQERGRAAKEVRGRRHVAAGERPAARRGEAGGRPGPELASVLVQGPSSERHV